MAQTVDVLKYILDMDTKKFVASSKKADKQTKKLSKRIGNDLTAGIKKAVIAFLGIQGLRMALERTTKAMVEFENGMTNVNTLLDVTIDQFSKLGKGVLEIAKVSPKTILDLTNGLYDLISAGVATEDALWALNQAQRAAVAGATDVKTAITGAIGTVNAFGKDISELTKVFDMQFTTVRFGVLTFEELAQSIGRVLPSAQILGVSLGEVHAALALLTKKGLTAKEAIDALNMTFLALADPIKQEAFRELGFEFFDINEKFIGMSALMTEINEKTKDFTDKQRSAFFGLIKLESTAIKGFANMVTSADEYVQLLERMEDVGAIETAHEKMAKTINNIWLQLQNRFSVMIIEMGNKHKDVLLLLLAVAQEGIDLIGASATGIATLSSVLANSVKAMWASVVAVWYGGREIILEILTSIVDKVREITGSKIFSVELAQSLGQAARFAGYDVNRALGDVEDSTIAVLDSAKLLKGAFSDILDPLKEMFRLLSGSAAKAQEINIPAPAGGFIGPMPIGGGGGAGGGSIFGQITKAIDDFINKNKFAGPAIQGIFDGLSDVLEDWQADLINIGVSLATGNWVQAAQQAVQTITREITDWFVGKARKVKEERETTERVIEEHTREVERNIEAIRQLTREEKQRRQQQLEAELQRLALEMARTDSEEILRRLQLATANWNDELRALNESLEDDALIAGIENFEDFLSFLAGQGDLTVGQAQTFAGAFTRFLDLSTEQQIELWEQILQQLIDSGNATELELINVQNILQDLNDQLEDGIVLDVTTPSPNQTLRSVTIITESQANLLLGVLNAINLEVRKIVSRIDMILEELRSGIAGNGSVFHITINSKSASGMAVAQALMVEVRAKGSKVSV